MLKWRQEQSRVTEALAKDRPSSWLRSSMRLQLLGEGNAVNEASVISDAKASATIANAAQGADGMLPWRNGGKRIFNRDRDSDGRALHIPNRLPLLFRGLRSPFALLALRLLHVHADR